MLITMVDGKVVYDDIQSSEKVMVDQCRIWESREREAIEKKEIINDDVLESRKSIAMLKQQRAAKESLIERFECKFTDVERRAQVVEEKTASTLKDTRLDQLAKKEEAKIKQEVKRLNGNQAAHHNKILNGMYTTEVLEKQLHAVYDREMRVHGRVRKSMDRLMDRLNRQDEVKLSIRKKINSIKEQHGRVFDLEPKIKDGFTRNQERLAKIIDLKSRVKAAEDEIKHLEDEKLRMVDKMEKLSVECGQKQKRSIKEPAMIEALKSFAPPQKVIECYNVKKPEIIKAFEKYTELYGNFRA